MGDFCLRDLEPEPMDISCVDVVPGAFSQLGVILVDRPTGSAPFSGTEIQPFTTRRTSSNGNGSLTVSFCISMDMISEPLFEPPGGRRRRRWKVSLDIDKVQPGVEELLGLADFVIPTIEFVQDLTSEQDWRKGCRKWQLWFPDCWR